MAWWLWTLIGIAGFLAAVAAYDVTQKRHSILRNFPIVGHLRFLLEFFGPELRQYIVSSNDEERPFSRDQRRWVYATSKRENQHFGFGTDNRIDTEGYILFRHAAFPLPFDHDRYTLASQKVLGEWRNRPHAFRPQSVINISAMSFGALSGPAIETLNRGAALAGCLHNTGEGGISDHHRQGGDLIFQFGTGYFGCRSPDEGFSMEALLESVASAPVKAIEVKISQGAKPGLGGLLPGAKVTREIAAARGVPVGVAVHSPSRHAAFGDVAGLIDFVETIADATGLPVGIKSAVGEHRFWTELVQQMAAQQRGPDFITIDGGEGGTGAAPLVFSDHVALPFTLAFAQVFAEFARAGLHRDVVFVGAGKLGFATEAMAAMAMGVDLINVGREAMLAIGCIQAQRCHTGHCPTGVATQSRWLARGLDPTDKSVRSANYVEGLRHELVRLCHAMGAEHPAQVDPAAISRRNGTTLTPLLEGLGYEPGWRP